MIVELVVLLAVALAIFYKWSTSTFDYFEKRNLPYDKPFPLFGSQKDLVMRKVAMYDHVNRLYKKFNSKVFGIFDQRTPVYVISDLALIKQITIKDFDHFVNHKANVPEEHDGLFSNSLAFMRDGRWKDMRSTLSPVFTGSKMRQMFTLINEVARESTEYLKKDPNSGTGIEMNIKDYFTRLSNDVIASSVFGLAINSFADENNEFYRMGKKVTKFSTWQVLKLFMNSNFEYLMKVFKMQLFDRRDTEYFKRLVLNAMKHRQEHKIFRPDMINMLMESKGIYITQGDQQKPVMNRQWTDVEIVAQCFLFFFAGFQTTAILMSFASHELMENPEIQEKLRQEIVDVSESLDGKPLTYEALHGMKYMDMVISESLRRWPVAVTTDRQCTKDFTYKDAEIEINLKAGDYIWIPIAGIHMDERYYPNPTEFDPERFSDENKANMQQFTYLPFGAGPRNCIGSRFALQEVKAIMFYLLKEFRIEAAAKTTIPVQLDPANINMEIKNGFWLKLVHLSEKMQIETEHGI